MGPRYRRRQKSAQPPCDANVVNSYDLNKGSVTSNLDSTTAFTEGDSIVIPSSERDDACSSDIKARRDECCCLTACAVLHTIDNRSSAQKLRPADVARAVEEIFITEYWDRKSRSFRQRGQQQILDVMTNIVGCPEHCFTRSKSALADKGSTHCSKKFLRIIGYGKRLPARRPLPPEYEATSTASNRSEIPDSADDAANATKGSESPPIQAHMSVESKRHEETVNSRPAARQRRRPSRLGFPLPETAPVKEEDGEQKGQKRKACEPAVPLQKRARSRQAARAEGEAREPFISTSSAETQPHITSSHQTSYPFLDSTDFYLDEDSLESQMQHLYNATCSFVDSKVFPSQQLRLNQSATFFLGPERDTGLSRLYDAVLGKDDAGGLMQQIYLKMLAPEVARSLIGAFFVSVAFAHPELETADRWREDRFALPKKELFIMEKQLNPLGTNFDTVLRRVYLAYIHSADFQDSTLSPIARDLAEELSIRLHDHLSPRRPHESHDTEYRDRAIMSWLQPFAKLIKRALTLKCELSSAREEYSLLWFSPGTKFDARLMESTHGPGEEVLVSVFPGLAVKHDGLIRPICPAQVRLK